MAPQQMTMQAAIDQCFKRIAELERAARISDQNCRALRLQMCSLQAGEAVRSAGRVLTEPVKFVSQYGEDTVIWDLLGRPVTGFFLEVGAFDGRGFSVTWALEQMGWTGLLVEPIPERAAECRANRPGSTVVHAAVGGSDASGQTTFTVTSDQHGGMLSYRGQATPAHRNELNATGAAERSVTVPFTHLEALLDGLTERVDAAVIDVEGAEVEVLKGLNLARFRPRVMVIEDNTVDPATGLMAFMKDTDYAQVATIGCNRVYVHKGETEIFARIPTLG